MTLFAFLSAAVILALAFDLGSVMFKSCVVQWFGFRPLPNWVQELSANPLLFHTVSHVTYF